jgi:hypothetical protein
VEFSAAVFIIIALGIVADTAVKIAERSTP